MSIGLLILAFICATFLFLLLVDVLPTVLGRRNCLPYPPGPSPNFLVGNAWDLPTTEPGQVFHEWGKKYNSDILYAHAFGTDIIVINSRAIAEELFEKRAHLYNDRPAFPIKDLIGWDYNFGFRGYNDSWRQHRKYAQRYFNPIASRQYQPTQLERVHHFLRGILQEPEKIFEHNKLLSFSLTLSMMYGYTPTTLDDPMITIAEEALHLGATLLGSGTLINVMPILGYIPPWVPGANTQRTAKRVKDMTEAVKQLPREHAEKAVRQGTAMPSLFTSFLEKKATEGASKEESDLVTSVAMTTYGGSSDTTIATVMCFLHSMLVHPDIQRKAQAEIDRVVGHDRLPDFTDRESLPYLEAIYREVLRFQPVLPAGVPHALMEDDVYNGYFLPKGATVISNIWGMTRDERVYPEPDRFNPERFFDADGKLNDDSRVLAYGFGRRICVGKHVVNATLYIIMVSFLACFDIRPAKDEQGKDMEINNDYDDFFTIAQKKRFNCSVTPRNDQVNELIEATAHK